MIRRDRITPNLRALREAVGDLDQHRASIAWEQYDVDRPARQLVEYALLRGLTAALDIEKEWAPPRRANEPPPRYGDGLPAMQEAGILDAPLASSVGDSIQLRNDLAHRACSLRHDEVFNVFQDADFLAQFADAIDRFLNAFFGDVQVGQVRTGVVSGITDYGAFVSLGDGIQGLLHISKMSSDRVMHPSDLVSVDDEVQVRVIEFDAANERVGLALEPLRREED